MLLVVFFIIWTGLKDIQCDIVYFFSAALSSIISFYISQKLTLSTQRLSILKLIKYAFWLIIQVIRSSLFVSKIIWQKDINKYSSLKYIKSKQNTTIGVIIYANSITLTPGTLTVNIDNNKILVHALNVKFIKELQKNNIDKKIKELIIKTTNSPK